MRIPGVRLCRRQGDLEVAVDVRDTADNLRPKATLVTVVLKWTIDAKT
jgi:hypothetical protein